MKKIILYFTLLFLFAVLQLNSRLYAAESTMLIEDKLQANDTYIIKWVAPHDGTALWHVYTEDRSQKALELSIEPTVVSDKDYQPKSALPIRGLNFQVQKGVAYRLSIVSEHDGKFISLLDFIAAPSSAKAPEVIRPNYHGERAAARGGGGYSFAVQAHHTSEQQIHSEHHLGIVMVVIIIILFSLFIWKRFVVQSKPYAVSLYVYSASSKNKRPKWILNVTDSNKTSSWSIGRSSKCTIVLKNSTISKLHAKIYYHQGTFFIVDKNSHNGILINKRKLIADKSYKIKFGAIYKLSNEDLYFYTVNKTS